MQDQNTQSRLPLKIALGLLVVTVVAAYFYSINQSTKDIDKTKNELADTSQQQRIPDPGNGIQAGSVKLENVEQEEEKKGLNNTAEIQVVQPVVETIRVESDGVVVLAGKSMPNATVEILLNEENIKTVISDVQGNFVSIFDIGTSTSARVLSLKMLVNGQEIFGKAEIIIAPSQVTEPNLLVQMEDVISEPQILKEKKDALETKTNELSKTNNSTADSTSDDEKEQRLQDNDFQFSKSVNFEEQKSASEVNEIELSKMDNIVADLKSGAEEEKKVTDGKLQFSESVNFEKQKSVSEVNEIELSEMDNIIADLKSGAEEEKKVTDGKLQFTKTFKHGENTSLEEGTVAKEAALEQKKLNSDASNSLKGKVGAVVIEPVIVEAKPSVDGLGEANADGDFMRLSVLEEQFPKNVAKSLDQSGLPNEQNEPLEQFPANLKEGNQPDDFLEDELNETTVLEDKPTKVISETLVTEIDKKNVEVLQKPLVVIANSDGVKVVQSGADEADDDLVVDTISYDAAGDVELAGRGQPSGIVRIYLDNMPVSTAAMDATGQWNTALSEIDAGIYTLRVDEMDQSGKVSSRLETPFKRESLIELAAYMKFVDDPARINIVTVQPGNTLWAIARKRYGRGILYVRVFEKNKDKIRDPNLIYPGQIFSLPD